ncbi:MAG TPA: hypothetical protein VK824_12195 [Planctomycetota bacterium]|nr:hypothetical protein [Planctomycetota bacterium]
MPVTLAKGRLGQLDVVVDGHVVATRKGGLVAKLVHRPFPADEDVVAAVRAALPPAS